MKLKKIHHTTSEKIFKWQIGCKDIPVFNLILMLLLSLGSRDSVIATLIALAKSLDPNISNPRMPLRVV